MKSDLVVKRTHNQTLKSTNVDKASSWSTMSGAADAVRKTSRTGGGSDFDGGANTWSQSGLSREISIVSAMQDHISCIKTENNGGEKMTLSFELDHMYAHCSGDAKNMKADEHMKYLRELLLLNLELIQQQQEQLSAKDREINALKKEKSELKKRLELVEAKRASEASTKAGPSNLANECASPDSTKSETPNTTLSKRVRRSNHLAGRRGRKRKIDICETQSTSSVSTLDDAVFTKKSAGSTCNTQQKFTEKSDEILQTDIMYYTNVGQMHLHRVTDSPTKDDMVLVPSWRVNPLTLCYQMEGTENLDDDIFLKRHQKLEVDEKRRKRWDIQRIREQRLQEKLKRGRSGNKELKNNEKPELFTLYPSPENVHFIEIGDNIPVTAFGIPVTFIESSEFSLPWNIKMGKGVKNCSTTKGESNRTT